MLFQQGHFSCKWAEIQQMFLLTQAVDSQHFTGALWAWKLINLLWKFNPSLWDAKNLDRHGHAPVQNQAIRKKRQQASVHALCNSSPLMLAADWGCPLPSASKTMNRPHCFVDHQCHTHPSN
jgi:hypothetical protein